MNDFQYTKSRGEFYYKNILWNEYTTIDLLKRIEKFQFKSSDIVINTFPRSGTTVTQEIVWHIKNKKTIKKNEKYGDIDERFPFLEFNIHFYNPNEIYAIDKLESQFNEPYRLIKTHCPLNFIRTNLYDAKPKCIVVFRNPRDVCVSLYHFYRGLDLFGPWNGEWEEFVEMFERGYTKCGSWLNWHQEWWSEIQNNNGNKNEFNNNPFIITNNNKLSILFYSFEMLIKNPKLIIESIAKFIDEPLTDEQLDIILTNTNFKQMYSDAGLNVIDTKTGFTFLRKGQIGNWKEHFTDEQLRKFDDYIESKIKEDKMNFEYE